MSEIIPTPPQNSQSAPVNTPFDKNRVNSPSNIKKDISLSAKKELTPPLGDNSDIFLQSLYSEKFNQCLSQIKEMNESSPAAHIEEAKQKLLNPNWPSKEDLDRLADVLHNTPHKTL